MSEITLQKWRITQTVEGVPYLLASTVQNHPHIGTGSYGHSTPIIWLETERGIAQTLNTLYHLGEPASVVATAEQQELIAKLHPKHVPAEIRRAHADRKPWPGSPRAKDDVVLHWVVERWSGLKPGKDY